VTRRLTDASPLVFLGKLGRLEVLSLGAEEVLVPSAVLDEIRVKADEAAELVERCLGLWLKECSWTQPQLLQLLPDLGAGERGVIAQALQVGAVSVVLDDLDARRTARRMGLRPIGTVGLLLAARKRGMVPSLRRELDRLEAHGFYASAEFREQVLREAGEA
jgi:uncharacterized protein